MTTIVNDGMGPWFEFYSVTAGVGATLMGLLFVAVSINAPAILGTGQDKSKRLAEQGFSKFLGRHHCFAPRSVPADQAIQSRHRHNLCDRYVRFLGISAALPDPHETRG
jgi:hypothetical protein